MSEKCGYCSSSGVCFTEDDDGNTIVECGECGKSYIYEYATDETKSD
jgi:hypothetical protein